MIQIVIARVSGITDALIAVTRQLRRNTSSTTTASAAPISIASRTDATAARTSTAWSYTGFSTTPLGTVFENCAASASMLSAIFSVLPPG